MTTLTYKQLNPKNETTPDACVIWLHGLGATADDFIPLVPQLSLPKDLAIRFIFPQAPQIPVTLNMGVMMPAWFDLLGLGLDSKQDELGIRSAEDLLAQLISEQIEQGIPSKKIVIAGFSQGGALALHSALRYPKKLAGVMALSSYLPLADFLEEEKSAANYGMSVFVAHGENDAVLPLVAAEMTCRYLRDLDYQVEDHIYSMAHEVCMDEVNDISVWLTKVLA
jgi:phospholipase/carboxylesterase